MEAYADIYLDPRPKGDGKCSVKIKVTHKRKRKYFATGVNLTKEEFKKIFFPEEKERSNKNQKEIKTKLDFFKSKANKVIDGLKVFTFEKFKEGYFESRDIHNDVSYAFEERIAELQSAEKIGTAVTYQCAQTSISKYKPNLTFAEITPKWLRGYEKQMLDEGRSTTTVSIYLRALRAVYNTQNIDKANYPFSVTKNDGRYRIKTGRNIKKALSIEEVAKIYHYTPENDMQSMARDYWMFLYLCNGMNVKDMCLLKWQDIKGNTLRYLRSKTSSTSKEPTPITVALKPESKAIIKRYGQRSLNPKDYIFPHLDKTMSAIRQRQVYQQLTKNINKHIQIIGENLEIPHHITTYSARHSFSTVLKRSGANVSMISDLLGHESLVTTQAYLDSFEEGQIQEKTDALTEGFKKVKS
ncbi:MAG: site-specific integrase [Bacteroidota bacterium]